MERNFDVKLECIDNNNISIRFCSNHNLKISVSQIKAFYQTESFYEYEIALVPVYVDNSATIKTFSFSDGSKVYTSLNFIIKDKTNKAQYAVQVPLNGDEIKYTQMIYEGANHTTIKNR